MPLGKGWYKVISNFTGENYAEPGDFENRRNILYMQLQDVPKSKYGFEICRLSIPNDREIEKYNLFSQTVETYDDPTPSTNTTSQNPQPVQSTAANVAGKKFYSLQGSATDGYYYFYLTFNENGTVIKSYAEKNFNTQGPEQVDDMGTYTVSGNRIDVNFRNWGSEVFFYKGRQSDGVRSYEAIEGEGATWRH